MNPELFVKLAAGYFGEYRPIVQKEVVLELSSWDAESIAELWDEAKRTIQTSYKTPPDVYFITNSEARKNQANRARSARIEARTRQLSAPAAMETEEGLEDYSDKIVSIFKGIGSRRMM